MPRFYFDVRDGDAFSPDDTGLELSGLKEAKEEASRTLGEMIKDAMPDADHRNMAIEVRDADHNRLLSVEMNFAVKQSEQQQIAGPATSSRSASRHS